MAKSFRYTRYAVTRYGKGDASLHVVRRFTWVRILAPPAAAAENAADASRQP